MDSSSPDAGDELHRDEMAAVGIVDVVDRDDVGMVEGGGGAGLLDEALPALGPLKGLRAEDFESDLAPEAGAFSEGNDPHAAFTELVKDLIVRNGLGRHQLRPL